MNPTDEPTIPDDLRDLLRSGSADLEVAPAEIRSVERRARQRRRRRHGIVAGGAAAVLLLSGLAVAQAVSGPDGSQRVVTATQPPAPKGSVPQPVLIGRPNYVTQSAADRAALDNETLAFLDGRNLEVVDGYTLEAVTESGATAWWTTKGTWSPTSGFVMADGRRFGVAANNPLPMGTPPEARLDEIGADSTAVASHPIPLDAPAGFEESVQAIGATGNELVLQRSLRVSQPEAGEVIEVSTSYSAIDVDTGAERPLMDEDGNSAAGAAGDVLVLAPGTDCTLEVSRLDGTEGRTLDGGCNGTIEGMGGLASKVVLSPDGRYAAATWMTISMSGPGTDTLTVVDLEDGRVLHRSGHESARINQIAWTGEHELTVSMEPERTPVDVEVDGVTVRTITWDTILDPSSGD